MHPDYQGFAQIEKDKAQQAQRRPLVAESALAAALSDLSAQLLPQRPPAPAPAPAPARPQRSQGSGAPAGSFRGVFPPGFLEEQDQAVLIAGRQLGAGEITQKEFDAAVKTAERNRKNYARAAKGPKQIQAEMVYADDRAQREIPGQAAADTADERAGYYETLAGAERDEQAFYNEQAAAAKAAAARFEEERRAPLNAYIDAVEDLASQKIDPDRWMNRQGSFSRVMSHIGVALGALGTAINKSPNIALQRIEREIERDIAAQREDLNTKRSAAAGRGKIYDIARQHFRDRQQVDDAARAMTYKAIAARARQLGSTLKGKEAQIEAQRIADTLNATGDQAWRRVQLAQFGGGRPQPKAAPGVFKVDPKNVATANNGKTYLFAQPGQKAKFDAKQSLGADLLAKAYELRRLAQAGAKFGENYDRAQALTQDLFTTYSLAREQGAISEGDADRYDKIINDTTRIFRVRGNAKNSVQQLINTFEGETNRAPNGGEEVQTDRVYEQVPGKQYSKSVMVARLVRPGQARQESAPPKPAKNIQRRSK